MSFLKRLFGGKDAATLRAEADSRFEASDFGSAKLLYERALSKVPSQESALRAALEERVQESRDGIARQRIDEAEHLLSIDAYDVARSELESAIEVAASTDVRVRAQRHLDALEQRSALRDAQVIEIDDEERKAIVVSQWSEREASELEPLGEPLLDAILALQDGEEDAGLREIEALHADASAPVYLTRLLAGARRAHGELEGAEEAYRAYLDALPDDAPIDDHLSGLIHRAMNAHERGHVEQAMDILTEAVERAPADIRVHKIMGTVLRASGAPKEAVEVLSGALELDEDQNDWQLHQQLGLAYEEAGALGDARRWLEQVMDTFKARGLKDFPVETAEGLARLYEAEGRLERAADMYRTLTLGSNRSAHARYHREAARLLEELGLAAEARRMLKRAEALLEEGSPEREDVSAALSRLDGAS